MAGQNKDEWSHWLQMRPLEIAVRALFFIDIYYFHECDLWGVSVLGVGWCAPTCSSQRHWSKEIKQAPIAPLCALGPYRRRLTHFSFPSVLLPEEIGVMQVCVGRVGWLWWIKASHFHLLYRDEAVTMTLKHVAPYSFVTPTLTELIHNINFWKTIRTFSFSHFIFYLLE